MSGHSKWASIKHKKGAVDAKRGKIFTKIIKEITVAARCGGGDPDGNPRLRLAIEKAKAASMPKDNIERGIKKGTGELEGAAYEESTYEGYGPGGAAVLIQTLTDNKNRTVSEIRHTFSKLGGNLAEAGSVAWMFKKCGYITVNKKNTSEDSLMEIALEAGAEDIHDSGEEFEIVTDPTNLESVKEAMQKAKIETSSSELTMKPQNTIQLEGKTAEQMLKLMEELEDNDDVQNVYANFDISDEVMKNIA